MPDVPSTESGSQPQPVVLPDSQTWVDEFGAILFRYAMLRVNDAQIAEELVQETFLAALKSRGNFQGKSSPATWFVAILKYKILDHFRGQPAVSHDQPALGKDPIVDGLFDFTLHYRLKPCAEPKDPADDAQKADFWRIFRRCLSALPENYRRAFVRVTVDGGATADVCKELKVSATNLSVLMYRARSRLRPCLEKNWLGAAGAEGAAE